MSKEPPERPEPPDRPESSDRSEPHDAELQRKIRSRRKYNMAEAIGRLGGADLLKGASPVTLKRQAELTIAQHLESQQLGIGTAFETVLVRCVSESAYLLEQGYERPIEALEILIDRFLRSEAMLRELVRQIDAEWGRINQERPFFERANKPPSPDDPYTISSVRNTLSQLLKKHPDG